MAYSTTAPVQGDNKTVLLKKLLQAWGGEIPNGPLNEREILRLILVRIGVVVPDGPHTSEELLALLLASFNGSSPSACENLSGVDADPNGVHTATFIGQIFLSAAGEGSVWQATALGDSNWNDITPTSPPTPCDADLIVGPGSGETLSFISMSLGGIDFTFGDNTEYTFSKVTEVTSDIEISGDNMTKVSFPALQSVGGGFTIPDGLNIAQILLPVLVSVAGDFRIQNTAITSLNLSAVESLSGNVTIWGDSLASFSAPAWLPTNGTSIDFSGAQLLAASVNHILARCRAAGVTTCTIDLGGTNEAPTGQGILDSAVLTLAGNTVSTN